MIDKSLIRDFPPMTATLLADHTGVFRVGTVEQHVSEADEDSAMRELVKLMQAEAVKSHRPIRVMVTDPTSLTQLLVGTDGALEEEQHPQYLDLSVPADVEPVRVPEPAVVEPERIVPPAPVQRTAPIEEPTPLPQPLSRIVEAQESASAPAAEPAAAPVQQLAEAPAVVSRRELREAPSFLAPPTAGPAKKGVAGLLNTIGFKVAASPAEIAEREDINAVSRHFPKRRTIAIVNRKGGANKTPTVVNLSSVFARYGGGGVVAWDNNETMGTLGWRTEQGGHESSVLDLLDAAEDLLSPGAERADLSRFVHHQPGDKYEVLRSAQEDERSTTTDVGEHVVTGDEVDLVHRVLAKYYRLIVMDSGNSAGAQNWLRMIEHTDQLVVPLTTIDDKKEGALKTLKAVDRLSEHGSALARNAVVIVSEAEAKDTVIANQYADDFRPYVRDVVVVPFDPALKKGVIRFDSLRSNTQRAWLAAAAAVARGL
ncbi:chromosome partitioning protein ParA [Plantibacter sp. Mn2098]|uniref:chromosome partitioning protein ParA n=1 Tax=Plantibacter sp. Mn2098 TaxID=3395266 RepID=UPI003BBF58D8